MYKTKSLKKYADDLAARLPAPGGGSAAAVAACLGVSLISMVINFTIGKPKYAAFERSLIKTLDASEKLRKRLMELVDLDVVAYQSKDAKKALGVPLEIAHRAAEAMSLCPDLVVRSNRNLISDVAVAVCLLESAFAAAVVNVDINLKYLADAKLSKKLRREMAKKSLRVKKIRVTIEEKVNAIIRG